MKREVLVAGLVGLVIVAVVTVLLIRPIFDQEREKAAEACPIPFFADNGERRAKFGGLKTGAEGVEVAGAELVNDPEIKALLSEKQNQLVLAEHFYCVALGKGEFKAGTPVGDWYRSKFNFLATGPSPEQMTAWEAAHPRPEDNPANFVLSELQEVEANRRYRLARWEGFGARFGVINEGPSDGRLTIQNFPRANYMLIANDQVQAADVVPVPNGQGVRFYVLLLRPPTGAVETFTLRAGGRRVYDVELAPPAQLASRIAETQAEALTLYSSSADAVVGADPQAAYARMLTSLNAVAKLPAPAAKLLAGDLLASVGQGAAAKTAYDQLDLSKVALETQNPELNLRLARVAQITGDGPALERHLARSVRPGETVAQTQERIERFDVIPRVTLDGDASRALTENANRLAAASPSPGVDRLRVELYETANAPLPRDLAGRVAGLEASRGSASAPAGDGRR